MVDLIVCKCSNITELDVREFMKLFPTADAEKIKQYMKIDQSCTCKEHNLNQTTVEKIFDS